MLHYLHISLCISHLSRESWMLGARPHQGSLLMLRFAVALCSNSILPAWITWCLLRVCVYVCPVERKPSTYSTEQRSSGGAQALHLMTNCPCSPLCIRETTLSGLHPGQDIVSRLKYSTANLFHVSDHAQYLCPTRKVSHADVHTPKMPALAEDAHTCSSYYDISGFIQFVTNL